MKWRSLSQTLQKASNRLMTSPNSWHSRQVLFLSDLAVLSGCREVLTFADGSRPDVAMIDTQRRTLFVGEAKDTERPGCVATRIRLFQYVQWLAAHAHGHGSSVLALCFSRQSNGAAWVDTVELLAHEAGTAVTSHEGAFFDRGLNVVRFVLGGPVQGGNCR